MSGIRIATFELAAVAALLGTEPEHLAPIVGSDGTSTDVEVRAGVSALVARDLVRLHDDGFELRDGLAQFFASLAAPRRIAAVALEDGDAATGFVLLEDKELRWLVVPCGHGVVDIQLLSAHSTLAAAGEALLTHAAVKHGRHRVRCRVLVNGAWTEEDYAVADGRLANGQGAEVSCADPFRSLDDDITSSKEPRAGA